MESEQGAAQRKVKIPVEAVQGEYLGKFISYNLRSGSQAAKSLPVQISICTYNCMHAYLIFLHCNSRICMPSCFKIVAKNKIK